MDFMQKVLLKQRLEAERDKRIKRKIKKAIACTLLISGAIFLVGFFYDKGTMIEETYTVQDGDTLRSISEHYLEKNTANRQYILEFEHNIKDLNPELKQSDFLYPGQKINIQYWVK